MLPSQATPMNLCIPGHTFERVAIERWLRTHGTSPMTGAALPHKLLVPAISLRQLIAEFSAARGGETVDRGAAD